MARIYVIANQKGGVGKTTTAANLGAFVALQGKRVLLVDFDPQGNLSSHFGFHNLEMPGIYEALTGEKKLSEVLVDTETMGLSLAPANLHLSGAAIELAQDAKREYYLKETLAEVDDKFDFIFIDCPPSLGVLTLNGFVAAERVLIPLQCEFFALEGLLVMLLNTIQKVQQGLNPNLEIGGIVFTMYDSRTRLGNDVITQVRNTFQGHESLLFETIIPRNIRLSEAPSHAQPIHLYEPDCVGAKSYEALAAEVIARG